MPRAKRSQRFLFEPNMLLYDPAYQDMGLEARGAYATLLANAWNQKVIGEFVGTDRSLAIQAMCSPEEWARVKPEVSVAFKIETIGEGPTSRVVWRLPQSHEAFESQQEWRDKARIRQQRKRKKDRDKGRDVPLLSRVGSGSGSGSGTEEAIEPTHLPIPDGLGGQVVSSLPPPGKNGDEAKSWREDFETHFWPAYWRKVSRRDALKAWMAIRPKTEAMMNEIMDGLEAQLSAMSRRETAKQPYAGTWLRAEGWTNDPKAL